MSGDNQSRSIFRPWAGCASATVQPEEASDVHTLSSASFDAVSHSAALSARLAEDAAALQHNESSTLHISPAYRHNHPDFHSTACGHNPADGRPHCTGTSMIASPSVYPFPPDLVAWNALRLLMEEEGRKAASKRRRERKFCCPKCPMTFSNKGQLTGHFRKHTGERPFRCESCGKRFARNEELTRHSRIHSGHRPFSCDLCDKRFGRKDHLNKHRRTHTGPLYSAYTPLMQAQHLGLMLLANPQLSHKHHQFPHAHNNVYSSHTTL